jgi:ubiquinone/menaquinone biosynthesis C-methylase UbiE
MDFKKLLNSERVLYKYYRRVQISPLMLERDKYLYIFKKLLMEFNDSLILNIGCGRDVLFSDLQRAGAEVIELDIVVEPLKELKACGAHHLIRADAHHLPFRDNIFDLVFMIGVLHHLYSIQEALLEVIRVVKYGKFALFSEPNKMYLPTRIIELLPPKMVYYLRIRFFPKLFRLYTPPARYERTLYPKEVRKFVENRVSEYYEIFNASPHIAIYSLQFLPLKLWEKIIKILKIARLWRRFCLFLSYKFIIICRK